MRASRDTDSLLPLLAVLALLLFGSGVPAGAALPEGINIDVQTGYGGLVKAGGMMPVTLRTENNGEENFSGYAEVAVRLDRGDVARYRVQLDLPPGSRKRYGLSYLHLPSLSNPPQLAIHDDSGAQRATVQLEYDEVLDENGFLTLVGHPGDGALGYLSADSFGRRSRSFFSTVGAEVSLRQFRQSEVGLGYQPLQDFPSTLAELEGADLIILLDGDYSQVDSSQVDALRSWVVTGGTLLVATGSNSQQLAASELSSLLPRTLESTTTVSELTAPLADYTGSAGAMPADASPGVIGVGEPVDNALTLAATASAGESYPLLVERPVGSGAVVEIAFDPLNPPFSRWPGNSDFFSYLLARYGSTPAGPEVLAHPADVLSQMSSLTRNFPQLRSTIFFFVLAYLLLLGPVNFITLARMGKHNWLWITVPALILVFSLGGYLLGFGIQGDSNRSVQIDQLYLAAGDTASYLSVEGIFTATSGELETRLTSPGVIYTSIPSPGGTQGGFASVIGGQQQISDRASGAIRFDGRQTWLTRNRPRWSYDFDFFTGAVDLDTNTSGIRVEQVSTPGGSPEGLVLNDSELELHDASVLTDRGPVHLGELGPGESYRLSAGSSRGSLSHSRPDGFSREMWDGYQQISSDLIQNLQQLTTSNRFYLVAAVRNSRIGFEHNSEFSHDGVTVAVIELSGDRLEYEQGSRPPGVRSFFLSSYAGSPLSAAAGSSGPSLSTTSGSGDEETNSLLRLLEDDSAVWTVELDPERPADSFERLSFAYTLSLQRGGYGMSRGRNAEGNDLLKIDLYDWDSGDFREYHRVNQLGPETVRDFPEWALSGAGTVRIRTTALTNINLSDLDAYTQRY